MLTPEQKAKLALHAQYAEVRAEPVNPGAVIMFEDDEPTRLVEPDGECTPLESVRNRPWPTDAK